MTTLEDAKMQKTRNRRIGKAVSHFLAATIALGAATTANAAFWDWKGNSSGTAEIDL